MHRMNTPYIMTQLSMRLMHASQDAQRECMVLALNTLENLVHYRFSNSMHTDEDVITLAVALYHYKNGGQS